MKHVKRLIYTRNISVIYNKVLVVILKSIFVNIINVANVEGKKGIL